MSDSLICVTLIRLPQRQSSDSEAFDDEDKALMCLEKTASVHPFNVVGTHVGYVGQIYMVLIMWTKVCSMDLPACCTS